MKSGVAALCHLISNDEDCDNLMAELLRRLNGLGRTPEEGNGVKLGLIRVFSEIEEISKSFSAVEKTEKPKKEARKISSQPPAPIPGGPDPDLDTN